MKRRSFLQAVGVAIAALFVPVAAATKAVEQYPFTRVAVPYASANLLDTEDAELGFWDYHPPETLAELRAAIESRYETVREFKHTPFEEISVHPLVIFTALPVTGVGSNEREAVLIAFNRIKEEPGGKELIWRSKPGMEWWKDFESGRECFVVSGRAMVRS